MFLLFSAKANVCFLHISRAKVYKLYIECFCFLTKNRVCSAFVSSFHYFYQANEFDHQHLPHLSDGLYLLVYLSVRPAVRPFICLAGCQFWSKMDGSLTVFMERQRYLCLSFAKTSTYLSIYPTISVQLSMKIKHQIVLILVLHTKIDLLILFSIKFFSFCYIPQLNFSKYKQRKQRI